MISRIFACHVPLQGVRRRPPPLSHPGVFSLTVRITERGVHVQACVHHSLARIGSIISSSSWLEVPESFHACLKLLMVGCLLVRACGIHAPSLATLCAYFSWCFFVIVLVF